MNHRIFAWSFSVLGFSAMAMFGVRDARAADDDILLEPKGTAAQEAEMRCMLRRVWREDTLRCLGRGSYAALTNVHLGMELAASHDTDHVDGISPAWIFSIESPRAGWGLGGSFAIDVVTAASTDIVATASPRWHEMSYMPSLYAHKTFGELGDFGLHGNVSIAPDDLRKHVGASDSVDLADKRIALTIGYDFGHDDMGRSGTPNSVFDRQIITHSIAAAVSFDLGKATVLSLSFTGILQNGDTSTSYRYIPTFSPEQLKNPELGQGAKIGDVSYYRSPIRPLDQLPTTLQRYVAAGSLLHRFSTSIFRMDVRPSVDSWGSKAITSNVLYSLDINDRLRIWPEVGVHYQTGADFWQRVYTTEAKPDGDGMKTITVPKYRTGDRELGPLVGATFGGGVRFAFGEERNWGVVVKGSAAYTRYANTLYVPERLTLLGATGLAVDLE